MYRMSPWRFTRALAVLPILTAVFPSPALSGDPVPGAPTAPPPYKGLTVFYDFQSGELYTRPNKELPGKQCCPDAARKMLNTNRSVVEGTPVLFVIDNVNTFLYSVHITGAPATFNTTVPAIFKSNSVIDASQAASQAAATTKKAVADPDAHVDPQASSPQALIARDATPQDTFVAAMSEYNLWADRLLQAAEMDRLLNGLTRKAVPGTMKADAAQVLESELRYADLKDSEGNLYIGPEAAYDARQNPARIVEAGHRLYGVTQDEYVKVVAAWEALSKKGKHPEADALKPVFDDATKLNGQIVSARADIETKFMNSQLTYTAIRDATFQVRDHARIATGDSLKYSFDYAVVPEPGSSTTAPAPTVVDDLFTLRVTSGKRINFSTGFFFTGLVDPSFYLRDEGLKSPVIRTHQQDRFAVSYGAMMHAYTKDDERLQVAPSFGLASSNNQLQYLAGLSLIFGDQKRVVFTIGASAGQVNALDGVEDSQQWDKDVIPQKKVTRIRWLVGLTYNLD